MHPSSLQAEVVQYCNPLGSKFGAGYEIPERCILDKSRDVMPLTSAIKNTCSVHKQKLKKKHLQQKHLQRYFHLNFEVRNTSVRESPAATSGLWAS